MKYITYALLIKIKADADCEGPFTTKTLTGTLSDKTIYMELDHNGSEKDLKDNGSTKIYISNFFNPGGDCDWEAY